MKKNFLILFLLLAKISVVCSQNVNTKYKGEIIYHVCQRSFYDSNGDMQGDLNGLKEKLPYLQDLGITSILLLPLYDADCYHNYFANDFEKIDAEFGTMQDYISVEEEVKDSNSLLNYYKKLIRLKQSNPALANGKYAPAVNENDKVFSFYRKFENSSVLVAVNLSNDVQIAKFDLLQKKKYVLLMGKSTIQHNAIQLNPYEVVVLEIK